MFMKNHNRVIFHIDVNSAYLSWEAVYRLQHGDTLDLREIPAVVGGDPLSRRGIVLTKSIPAKKFGIQTGETLFSARQKCPDLKVVPPSYGLYLKCSNAMVEVLRTYSPLVQRYSVDECFLDYTHMEKKFGPPLEIAHVIKEQIKRELGFTVNIGVSCNKLLAKMGSDLKKPDLVHTLFPEEIPIKMWPLPIEDLFMVGRATAVKLRKLGITNIGELANYDAKLMQSKLKSHGLRVWQYAHGIDDSPVRTDNYIDIKGLGNSTTTPYDVENKGDADKFLLSLTENVASRLRKTNCCCRLVSVSIRNSNFRSYSHQKKLPYSIEATNEIYEIVKTLFRELWNKEPIRHFGVRVSELCSNDLCQLSIFNYTNYEKNKLIDTAIDDIRAKYGNTSIVRASFINSGIKPINGGVGEGEYPLMSSLL